MHEHEPVPPAAEIVARVAPVPSARPGPGMPITAAMALQRSAGNCAVARLLGGPRLQRNGPTSAQNRTAPGALVRSDPSPPMPNPALGPLPLSEHQAEAEAGQSAYAAVAAYLAAHHYTSELHRELVRHYVWGGGAPFRLSRDQMHQVIAPGSTRLNILGGTRWPTVRRYQDLVTQELRAGGRGVVTKHVHTSTSLFCDPHLPTLGEFTAHLDGTLTAYRASHLLPAEREAMDARADAVELRNELRARLASDGHGSARAPEQADRFDPDAIYFSFEGEMHWFDRWDFDPHVPAAAGTPRSFHQTRSDDAERGVRLAHDNLPGQPFDVVSETVTVSQAPGTASATF